MVLSRVPRDDSLSAAVFIAVAPQPEMAKLQFPIAQSDYSFLSHNSFLNCSSLTTIDKNKLSNSIASGETTIKGQLSNEDVSTILGMVRESKLYSKVERETYFAEG